MQLSYTVDQLKKAAAEARSVTGVLRLLGLSVTGASHAGVSKALARHDVDVSHFGVERSRGGIATASTRRLTAAEILQISPVSPRRRPAPQLRRALQEVGVPYRCVGCGLSDTWNSGPLSLEIDHLNGNWRDNRAENLRYLCPNCHSQCLTSQFSSHSSTEE